MNRCSTLLLPADSRTCFGGESSTDAAAFLKSAIARSKCRITKIQWRQLGLRVLAELKHLLFERDDVFELMCLASVTHAYRLLVAVMAFCEHNMQSKLRISYTL